MAIGTMRLHLCAALAVALLPAASIAAVSTDSLAAEHGALSKTTPTAAPAIPRTSVAPVSTTARATTDTEQRSDFVANLPDQSPYARWERPVFAGLSVSEIVAIGAVIFGLVMFARRRHRRRVGWGVMPARPSIWDRFAD